jgi:hypothetical protein
VRQHLLAAVSVLILTAACQSPAVSVSPTETVSTGAPDMAAEPPIVATASVWGEVPKECA